MKKIINIMFIAVLSAISLASCDKGFSEVESVEGTLSFEAFEASVYNAEDVIESRAASVDVNTFKVVVSNKTTGVEAGSWTYGSLPEVVELPVGEYTVKVYNQELQDAAWDAPYFYGEKDFSIKKNDVTQVEAIVCKLSNLKVSIKYSEEMQDAIGTADDVKVNVQVGDGASLDFVYGEERAGYFRCGADNKSLVATFSGSVEGFYISEYKVISDVAPCQHRIITFSLKSAPDVSDEYGLVGTTGLSLNAKVTTVDLTRDVAVEEELIQPDDFMTVSDSELSYGMSASSKEVTVSASAEWTASSSASWCTVSPATGAAGQTKLNVSVSDNTVESERTAVVTVTMGSIVREIAVKQAAYSEQPSVAAPTVVSVSEGIELNKECVITTTSQVVLEIQAEAGVEKLEVKIISNLLTAEELAGMGLREEFDLAEPGDAALEENLVSLGFPVGAEVKGVKDVITFDISSFMGMLALLGSDVHTFRLTVTDSIGQVTSVDLILKVE